MTQGGGQSASEFHGQGRDLHTAIEDAWSKRSQNDPKTLRVAEDHRERRQPDQRLSRRSQTMTA